MNMDLRHIPVTDTNRFINLYPEDVELIRITDFITAYQQHCDEFGTNRFGDNPAFTWTVRPNLHLYVIGYAVHDMGNSQ